METILYSFYYKNGSSKFKVPIHTTFALDPSTQIAHETPWARSWNHYKKGAENKAADALLRVKEENAAIHQISISVPQ